MKKMVPLSRQPAESELLVAWLRTLFPECDICVQAARMENFARLPVVPGLDHEALEGRQPK